MESDGGNENNNVICLITVARKLKKPSQLFEPCILAKLHFSNWKTILDNFIVQKIVSYLGG
jgi:hypothetical protein